MKSILDLYRALNSKIDKMAIVRTDNDFILENIYNYLILGDIKGALDTFSSNFKERPNFSLIIRKLTEEMLPEFELKTKNLLLKIKDKLLALKELLKLSMEITYKKADECERLEIIINKQNIDYNQQRDSLLNEKNEIKDLLIKLLFDFGNSNSLISQIDLDLINEIKNILESKNANIFNLGKENEELKNMTKDLKLKIKNLESQTSTKQIEEQKEIIKRLQFDNVNFSDAIQKLTEKNIKLKQEVIGLSNENKKYTKA
jgi:hypothetical protein